MKKYALSLALVAVAASAAQAIVLPQGTTQESATYAGTWTMNIATGQTTFLSADSQLSNAINGGPAIRAIPGTTNAAFSNPTAGAPTYGDDYLVQGGTGPNPLTSMQFSLFNSASTASGTPTPITAAAAAINIYNEDNITAFPPLAGNPALGSFTANFNFGSAPLQPGFYILLSITGLDSLNMVLPDGSSGISGFTLITQKITPTGSARHGVVSVAAPTVGVTGGNDFYMFPNASAPTGEGFYTSGTTPVNVAYELVVAPEPTSLAALAGLSLVARRRRA